jgi:hypothetical protein
VERAIEKSHCYPDGSSRSLPCHGSWIVIGFRQNSRIFRVEAKAETGLHEVCVPGTQSESFRDHHALPANGSFYETAEKVSQFRSLAGHVTL